MSSQWLRDLHASKLAVRPRDYSVNIELDHGNLEFVFYRPRHSDMEQWKWRKKLTLKVVK